MPDTPYFIFLHSIFIIYYECESSEMIGRFFDIEISCKIKTNN